MPEGERADCRIPVTEATREMIREVKDEKVPYDKWLRDDPRLPGGGR